MASTFVEFGSSNQKHYKDMYALNVLDFKDGSTFEDRKTSESSSSIVEGSTAKSIAT